MNIKPNCITLSYFNTQLQQINVGGSCEKENWTNKCLSVCIMTDYEMDDRGSVPDRGKRPALGHIRPANHCIPRDLFFGVKAAEAGS
jgi:hypothetical protein